MFAKSSSKPNEEIHDYRYSFLLTYFGSAGDPTVNVKVRALVVVIMTKRLLKAPLLVQGSHTTTWKSYALAWRTYGLHNSTKLQYIQTSFVVRAVRESRTSYEVAMVQGLETESKKFLHTHETIVHSEQNLIQY